MTVAPNKSGICRTDGEHKTDGISATGFVKLTDDKMTIPERAKSWGVTVLLGIIANALWYWIIKSPFHPTWHDAFQLAYFITIAGVGVFLGKRIGSDKTPAKQKLTVVPAAASPCLEINGNDGEVTVRLSVFSALDLNLSYVKARLATGNHPQAVIFQHGEPQKIERYKREN